MLASAIQLEQELEQELVQEWAQEWVQASVQALASSACSNTSFRNPAFRGIPLRQDMQSKGHHNVVAPSALAC